MEYENKTNEELIDLLEGQNDKIEELEQEVNEASELTDEILELQNQIDDFNSAVGNREEVSEKAYYSGFNDAKNESVTSIKGWLNFKVENRI